MISTGPSLDRTLPPGRRRRARRGLAELTDATDPPLVTSILAVLAISKGLRTLGRLAVEFTEDEREELIEAANRP